MRQFTPAGTSTNPAAVAAGTTTQPRRTNSAPAAPATVVAQTTVPTATPTTATPTATPTTAAPTSAQTATPTIEAPTNAPTAPATPTTEAPTAVPTATVTPTPAASASAGAPIQIAQQPVVEPNVPSARGVSNQQPETTSVHQQSPPSNMMAWRSKGKLALLLLKDVEVRKRCQKPCWARTC